MAEALPSYRLHQPVHYTEGGDLSGGSSNNWISEGAGSAEERVWISHSFYSAAGYAADKLDYSNRGQAVKFHYDLSQSVYARKRQFMLGAYAYVKSKSLTSVGSLPSNGKAVAALCGTNDCSRKPLKRSYNSFAESDVPFAQLSEGAYHKVSMQYLYPQLGISSSGLYNDTDYQFDAEVVLCGAAGENPPYLDVAAEDVEPYAANVSPQGIFADRTEDISLRWTFAYDSLRYAEFEGVDSQTAIAGAVYGELKQQAAMVRWTEDDVNFHEISVGAENCAYIPAGSVTADKFRWQVKLQSDDGVWGAYSQWFEVPTDNDSLSTATALSPKNISIDGDSANVFVWAHQNASGSRPTAAELQYSLDGESWQSFHTYEGRNCQCEVPAGSLPSGSLFWRVRTYNASGVAGAWSTAVSLTVITKPMLPQLLEIGSNPLPLLRWSSEDQYSAQIDIDGVVQRVYGSAQSLRWENILEAGEHRVRLRSQNRFALWSDWCESSVITVNSPFCEPLLTAESKENRVLLRWDCESVSALIYRDGKLIKTLHNARSFLDDGTVAAAEYRVRLLNEEGSYADSNALMAAPILEAAALGSGDSWLSFRGRYEEPAAHTCRAQQKSQLHWLSGRTQPLSTALGCWEISHEFAFSLRPDELPLLEKLKVLSGSVLVYKDARGDLAKGVLREVKSVHRGTHIDLSFTLTEAEQEGIC